MNTANIHTKKSFCVLHSNQNKTKTCCSPLLFPSLDGTKRKVIATPSLPVSLSENWKSKMFFPQNAWKTKSFSSFYSPARGWHNNNQHNASHSRKLSAAATTNRPRYDERNQKLSLSSFWLPKLGPNAMARNRFLSVSLPAATLSLD